MYGQQKKNMTTTKKVIKKRSIKKDIPTEKRKELIKAVEKTINERFTRHDLFLAEVEGYKKGYRIGHMAGFDQGKLEGIKLHLAVKEIDIAYAKANNIGAMAQDDTLVTKKYTDFKADKYNTNISIKWLTYLVYASILFVIFYKYLEYVAVPVV